MLNKCSNISRSSLALFLLYVEIYFKVCSLFYFSGVRSSSNRIFPANSNSLFIRVVGHLLWWRVSCIPSRRTCQMFLLIMIMQILRDSV